MNGCRLDHAECLALMSRVSIGRVVFTAGGLPAVHPVAFVLDAGVITFRADDERIRLVADRGDVVAFQADDIDAVRNDGWTVTAIGHCSPAAGDQVRVRIEAVDGRLLPPVRRVAAVRRQVPF